MAGNHPAGAGPGRWDGPDPACATTSDPERVSHSQAQAGPNLTPRGGESSWAGEQLVQVPKSMSDSWSPGSAVRGPGSVSILLLSGGGTPPQPSPHGPAHTHSFPDRPRGWWARPGAPASPATQAGRPGPRPRSSAARPPPGAAPTPDGTCPRGLPGPQAAREASGVVSPAPPTPTRRGRGEQLPSVSGRLARDGGASRGGMHSRALVYISGKEAVVDPSMGPRVKTGRGPLHSKLALAPRSTSAGLDLPRL